MDSYIDLDRTFRDLTDAELEDPEHFAALGDDHPFGALRWPEVLANPRVVLLAEAGSGKTWEMQEQVRRLRQDGKAAFFIPLESLDRESLTDALSADDERDFHAWLLEGHSPGWFFLDSVDELKLTQGRLRTALRHFAKSVGGQLAMTATDYSR